MSFDPSGPPDARPPDRDTWWMPENWKDSLPPREDAVVLGAPTCGPHGPMRVLGEGLVNVWYKCETCSRTVSVKMTEDDELAF